MDGLDAFVFIKNNLNAYFQKDGLNKQAAEIFRGKIHRFLDWLQGERIGKSTRTLSMGGLRGLYEDLQLQS